MDKEIKGGSCASPPGLSRSTYRDCSHSYLKDRTSFRLIVTDIKLKNSTASRTCGGSNKEVGQYTRSSTVSRSPKTWRYHSLGLRIIMRDK